MLEPILKGLVEWIYQILVDIMSYASGELIGVLSMDLSYFESTAPIISDIVNVFIALGWALLIGNLVFQLLKSIVSGIGFEAEDPKIVFFRTFVFAFLLLASRQICEIGLSITSTVIDLLDVPSSINVEAPGESMFSLAAEAKWLLVIIVGVVLMVQMVKLLFEIGERYVITSVLTFFAPLAFAMGGSKNTNDIFKGWVRMYCSMLVMMIMNIVFLKLIMSAMSRMAAGNVLVWLVFVVALTRVARKIDSHIGKIGLNPAQTGDALGSRIPGMMSMMAVRVMSSAIGKSISNSRGSSGRSARGGRGGRGGAGGVGRRGNANRSRHHTQYGGVRQTPAGTQAGPMVHSNNMHSVNEGINKNGPVVNRTNDTMSSNTSNGNIERNTKVGGVAQRPPLSRNTSGKDTVQGGTNIPIATSVPGKMAVNNRSGGVNNSSNSSGNINSNVKAGGTNITKNGNTVSGNTVNRGAVNENSVNGNNVSRNNVSARPVNGNVVNGNTPVHNKVSQRNNNPGAVTTRGGSTSNTTVRSDSEVSKGGNDIHVIKGNAFDTGIPKFSQGRETVNSTERDSRSERVSSRQMESSTIKTVRDTERREQRVEQHNPEIVNGRHNPAAVNRKAKSTFYQKSVPANRINRQTKPEVTKAVKRRPGNGKNK